MLQLLNSDGGIFLLVMIIYKMCKSKELTEIVIFRNIYKQLNYIYVVNNL